MSTQVNTNDSASQAWEPYKEIVRNLYLTLDHSLEEVTQELNHAYSFAVSKAQVEYRCKQWNFRKNLTKQEWHIVSHKIQKRKSDDKESEVSINGLPITQKKIKKAMSRHGGGSSSVSVIEAISPQTPEGIIIRTPTSGPASTTLDTTRSPRRSPMFRTPSWTDLVLDSLPFTSFRSAVTAGGYRDNISIENLTAITSPNGIPAEIVAHFMNKSVQIDQTAQLNHQIEVIMPESLFSEDYGFGVTTARHDSGSAIRFLSLTLYMVSNKMISSKTEMSKAIYKWMRRRPSEGLLEYLLSVGGPTSEALAEHIFALAIEEKDPLTVEALLAFGLDPNDIKCHNGVRQLTPLQVACRAQHLRLVRILVQAGADVNSASSFTKHPLLCAVKLRSRAETQTDRVDIELISVLLHAGACVNPSPQSSPLFNAATQCHPELVDLLLNKGADPSFIHPEYISTPLIEALCSGGPISDILSMAKSLIDAGADINARPSRDGDLHTALSSAIDNTSSEVVKLLLDHGVYVSELEFSKAVACGKGDIVDLLVNSGARVTSTVMVPAIARKDMKMFELLLDRVDNSIKNNCQAEALTAAILHGFEELIVNLSNSGTALLVGHKLRLAIQAAATRADNTVLRLLLNRNSKYRASAVECLGDSLSLAIMENHDETVELLLEAGADVKPTAYKNPLLAAIRVRNLSLSRKLLAAGASINRIRELHAGDLFQWITFSVLPAAVSWGYQPLIRQLIQSEAKIDAIDETEFEKRISESDEPMVDVSDLKNAKTALTIAVEKGDSMIIQQLIEAGADVNAPATERYGNTALVAAISNQDYAMVCQLLDLGANPDESALLVAVYTDIDILQTLLTARSTRVRQRSRNYGIQAMQHAIASSQYSMVSILLNNGVDPNSPAAGPHFGGIDKHFYHEDFAMYEEFPLGTAIRLDQSADLGLIRALLDSGADPSRIICDSVLDEGAHTGILAGIKRKSLSIVELMVAAGADINSRAEARIRRTPLQSAAEQGIMDITKFLLEKGAEVNACPHDRQGATALQFAAIKGYLGIASLLLEHGANVNAPAAKIDGRTALEGACEHGRIDMVQLLLSAGAQVVGLGSEQYERARDFTMKNGHRAVRRLLETFRAQQLEIVGD